MEEINVQAGGTLRHITHKNLAALENKELEWVLGFVVFVFVCVCGSIHFKISKTIFQEVWKMKDYS